MGKAKIGNATEKKKRVFPCVGVGGIIGASMAGKGFITFDLMAVMAEGG